MLLIRDVDLGSRILIFFHPRSRIQEEQKEGGGASPTFLAAINLTKLTVISFFKRHQKAILTQKIVAKALRNMVWDPGFEIPDPEKFIPDPGVKIAHDPGSYLLTYLILVG